VGAFTIPAVAFFQLNVASLLIIRSHVLQFTSKIHVATLSNVDLGENETFGKFVRTFQKMYPFRSFIQDVPKMAY
jgi:hypothetical protein